MVPSGPRVTVPYFHELRTLDEEAEQRQGHLGYSKCLSNLLVRVLPDYYYCCTPDEFVGGLTHSLVPSASYVR